jgi:hypothetical protein
MMVGMARTASDRLVLFEQIRDKVEGALLSGSPVVSYSVDGQVVTKEPTSSWLSELDSRIADLRKQTTGGLASARNLVRFRNV